MGKENADLLNSISFDLTLLDTAANSSAKCADVLAIANGSKQIHKSGIAAPVNLQMLFVLTMLL